MFPKRKDLLDRANQIIAEHFGMVLAPTGTSARPNRSTGRARVRR